MPPGALALLLAAAALHTAWNLLVKRAQQKHVFTWWALVVGSICFAPLLALGPALPSRVWPYAFASALAEVAYFVALLRAYDQAEFSLVYPLARGTAPALLAIWSVVFLGEQLQPAGVAGLMLLVLGLVVVGSSAWWVQRGMAAFDMRGIGAALSVAFCISLYSAIDGAAVRFAAPAPYTVLVIGLTTVLITPAVLARYGPGALLAEWRANWPGITAVGILTLVAYLLVLQAYAIGRVSYAGAIREISIVFAALVGWRWMGEGFGAPRTIGAALMFLGIMAIAVGG